MVSFGMLMGQRAQTGKQSERIFTEGFGTADLKRAATALALAD